MRVSASEQSRISSFPIEDMIAFLQILMNKKKITSLIIILKKTYLIPDSKTLFSNLGFNLIPL